MDTFRERFGMTDIGAASEVGMVVGFNEKPIRTWKNVTQALESLVNPTRANLVCICLMTKNHQSCLRLSQCSFDEEVL